MAAARGTEERMEPIAGHSSECGVVRRSSWPPRPRQDAVSAGAGEGGTGVRMRWMTHARAITIGLLILPTAGHAQSPGNRPSTAQTKRVSEERDRTTNALFTSTIDADGSVRLTVSAGDFLLEKALASSGDTTLRLSQGKDVVTIAMTQTGYVVARGKRTARFDPRAGQADGRDSIRSVLLGSQAVRTFKRLSAALENRDGTDDEGPLLMSALIDGALVEMLDGDTGATERIGKRLTRKRLTTMHAVKLKPGDMFRDCILMYELALIDAWDLFFQCLEASRNSPWWIAMWAEDFCEWEWLIRTQQYVWQFITCLALPI